MPIYMFVDFFDKIDKSRGQHTVRDPSHGFFLGGNGIMAFNARNGLKPLSSGVITEQPPEPPQTVPSMASCAMPCVAQQDVETTTNGGGPKRF